MYKRQLLGREPEVDVEACQDAIDRIESTRGVGIEAMRFSAITTVVLMLRQLKEIASTISWQQHHADTPMMGRFS